MGTHSVLVTGPDAAPARPWVEERGARWLYLGKRTVPRQRLEVDFGRERALHLGDRLHGAAERLRQPFLDFVSEVGALQPDTVTWWSTSFSWKNWGASDLFLLICYLEVAREVAEEAIFKNSPLLIAVEDPWLRRQLRANFGDRGEIRFQSNEHLLWARLRALFVGGVKRKTWALDVAWRLGKQRLLWRRPKHDKSARTIGIYSFSMTRCFEPNDEWRDPFLPGLDAILESVGFDVFRFAPPESRGFERELASRSSYFRPLILEVTLSSIVRTSLTFWRPRWPTRMRVASLDVGQLALREWWQETARTSLFAFRFYDECLRRMLQEGACEWIVYPYENQPWEKLTAFRAKQAGVRTAGIQHNALSRFYMSYFLGDGDSDRMPLPDVVFSSGPYPHRVLSEGGMPQDRLVMTGSLRYDHVARELAKTENGTPLGDAPREDVLVVLPIDMAMSAHLLDAIRRGVVRERGAGDLRFHIKPHPTRRLDIDAIGFPAVMAPDDVGDALGQCGTVLFVGTNVGPEAVGLGRLAVRYRPELLLNVDPAEAYGDAIPSCDDTNVIERLSELVNSRVPAQSHRLNEITAEIFAPPDRELLKDVFVGSRNGRTLQAHRQSAPSPA